jgi:hypothetical protein
MAYMTSQQLADYYREFRKTEVTFNTQVIVASGLVTADVHLKFGNHNVPCVLYACSMAGARVIAELTPSMVEELGKLNNSASLRLGFRQKDESVPATFFVNAKVDGLTEYNAHRPNARFAALSFTQQPSDVLIGVLGSLLEITANAARRRDERIVMTPESMKRIGMDSRESCLAINGLPQRCIVRDLSFGGAKVLLPSGAVGLEDEKKVTLKLGRCEMKEDVQIDGSIVRVEDVQGHSDVVALSIQYSTEPPISYKQKINSYFHEERRTTPG